MGKTLNFTMIMSFYKLELDENGDLLLDKLKKNRVLFEGGMSIGSRMLRTLKIASHENIMEDQGKYPVIYLVFPYIESYNSITEINNKYKQWIENTFLRHQNIYKHMLIKMIDNYKKNTKNDFKLTLGSIEDLEEIIADCGIKCSSNLHLFKQFMSGDSNIVLRKSLGFLIDILYHNLLNRKVVVLVDRYDAPITSTIWAKSYVVSNSIKRSILSVLKSNLFIKKAILSGSFPISLDHYESEISMFSTHSILRSEISEHFGFTVNEDTELLEKISNCYNADKFQQNQS